MERTKARSVSLTDEEVDELFDIAVACDVPRPSVSAGISAAIAIVKTVRKMLGITNNDLSLPVAISSSIVSMNNNRKEVNYVR